MVANLRLAIAGDDEWKDSLGKARGKMGKELEAAIERKLIAIEGGVKKKYDNEVLRRRTSTLFRSPSHRLVAHGLDSYGEVGTPIEYAPIHEFGGVIEDGFGRGIRIEIPARPVWGPTFDELRGEILRDIFFAIGKGLDAA